MGRRFSIAVKLTTVAGFFLPCLISLAQNNAQPQQSGGADAVDVGSRLELFVDDLLIDNLSGGAERRMHRPEPRNVVHTLDKPWEGNTSAYLSVVHDKRADRILLYFNASPEGPYSQTAGLIMSRDGIHFTRPELGMVTYRGSKENNLLPIRQKFGTAGHHFTPFIDKNPDAPDEERFKATARPGFSSYTSPDGIEWRRLSGPAGVGGPTDSQNLAFWDPLREIYVGYLRAKPEERGGIRDIRRTTSEDFVEWSETELINYTDDRRDHMYTNGIRPYFRAPHIYIGLPNRIVPHRKKITEHPHRGTNDVVLMSSRDGQLFERWDESFIRPGPEPEVWTDRNNYPAWGMVQTAPDKLSLYWTEHYRHPGMRIRRGTIRIDGFASLYAGGDGGEMLTKPLMFSGDRLVVNYQTSAAGHIQFELTDKQGEPIPGFALGDCETLFGNAIAHMVAWGGNSDLTDLQGQEVRLRVRLQEADIYSIRFDTTENIRSRLQNNLTEAEQVLDKSQESFAYRTREELVNSIDALSELLAAGEEPAPDWLRTGAALKRAKHNCRKVTRAETRALNAMNAASKTLDKEVEFGRLYQGAVKILREKLQTALDNKGVLVDRVDRITVCLEQAVKHFAQAEDTGTSAAEAVETADKLMNQPEEGFGQLFQNRIGRRRDSLRELLGQEQATRREVQESIERLEEAVAQYREIQDFPPVQASVVTGAPAVFSLNAQEEWQRGLLVNTAVVGDDLVMDDEVMLRFEGEDDCVECVAGDELKPDVVTVEAWVKARQYYRQWYPIVVLGRKRGEEDSWTEHAYNLWVDGDRPQFTLGGSDEGAIVRTGRGASMELGEWQHLAGQFDGDRARLYLNGRSIRTAEYDGEIDYSWADVVRIGGSLGGYSGFEGQIRDVRIWKTARTESEIRENMHAALTGDEEGLVAHWIAGRNAGKGDAVYDRSSFDNDGRITGASWVIPQGYRLSGPISFPGISEVSGSSIRWDATIDGDAESAPLDVLVGVSGSEERLPDEWRRADSGEQMPLVTPGQDMRGRYVWVRINLAATDPAAGVRLHKMSLEVE